MDLYNAFESRSSENYLIQGIESNGSPFSDSLEAMYTDGTQEYLVDQGLYYPAATNYGYYCTGYESQQGGWEEQHRLFGVDGVGAQYLGQGECFPYVYYTPCYGYGHSVYSPYSPSCGGVGVGAVDSSGPFVDHYYTAGGCENAVSVASSSSAAHQQLPWWNNVKDVPSSGASLASNHRPVPGPVVRVSEPPPPPPPKKKHPSRDAAQPAQRQAVAGGSSSRSDDRISVKAYTRKAGDRDSEGNIIIRKDEYNRGGFALGDYAHGRFFVIKSYSEDDVHKSIKYNVWSSTPNGNKKLNAAYEASRGCRVLLFFSVNASGQFCGAAEMTGPVDFYRDMDFWQQDKWSGSFPVRWHFIKDVPNTYFRHILLENNENKPVTNSRDTQEVKCLKGVEMLRIFNNYTVKTSLLDDFMFYEKRQEMMMMRSPDHDDDDGHQVSESPLVGAAAAEFSAISIQDDDRESLVCKAPRPSPAFLRVGTISLSLHDDDHPHMK